MGAYLAFYLLVMFLGYLFQIKSVINFDVSINARS